MNRFEAIEKIMMDDHGIKVDGKEVWKWIEDQAREKGDQGYNQFEDTYIKDGKKVILFFGVHIDIDYDDEEDMTTFEIVLKDIDGKSISTEH